MSDILISQLPTYTGDPSGVWVIINNSGNTSTFKAQLDNIVSGGTSGSGTSGTSGSSGSSGTSGTNGTSGSSGSSGVSGTSGSSGSSGVSGTSGTSGSSGSSGVSGTSGSSGSSGVSGTSGTSGSSGTSGDSQLQDGEGALSVQSIYYASGNTKSPYGVMIGGTGNTITNTGDSDTIIGGFENSITAGQRSVIMGGRNNVVDNQFGGIIGGAQNNAGYLSFVGAGFNNQANGNSIGIVGGENNTWSNCSWGGGIGGSGMDVANSTFAFMAGGASGNIYSGEYCSIVNGQLNGINDLNNNASFKAQILNGEQNKIRGGARFASIYNGYNNILDTNANFSSIYQSANSTIQGNGAFHNSIMNSDASEIFTDGGADDIHNTISSCYDATINNSAFCGIYNSSDNADITSSTGSTIFGSRSVVIDGATNNCGVYSSEVVSIRIPNGGVANIISGSENCNISGGTMDFCSIVGSDTSRIVSYYTGLTSYALHNSIYNTNIGNIYTETGQYNTILGGRNNYFSATTGSYNTIQTSQSCNIKVVGGQYNGIYNSQSTNIDSETNRTIGIGLSGRTLSMSSTTHFENSHTFRTYSTEVQPITSGVTFTCNLNNGGKAQFFLTGASTIDITNVRDGQSFLLKTTTSGGHSITWTSTGYTFAWKGGDSTPSNNKTDLWRFEVFGSVIFGEKIADFT